MERFRVGGPDTLQLQKQQTSTPVSAQMKVLSYRQGTCDKGSVTVSKYPDGTVILDDGHNRVIQRPWNHPEHRAVRRAQFIKNVQNFFKNLSSKLFRPAH